MLYWEAEMILEASIRTFELDRVKVSLTRLGAVATGAALAAKKVTSTIPIVFTNVADPLAPGVVTSLARPGGNITGLSSLVAELGGKRLELLKEALPRVSHVAVLWNSAKGNTGGPYTFKQTEVAGLKLGLQIQSLAVAGPSELERVLEAASQKHAGAVLVQDGPHFLSSHAKQIVDLAAKRRLPRLEDCCLMVTTCEIRTGTPLGTSTKSSRGPSPPTCPSSNPPNSS
jgi:putative ABC transport system substrate-binding protein